MDLMVFLEGVMKVRDIWKQECLIVCLGKGLCASAAWLKRDGKGNVRIGLGTNTIDIDFVLVRQEF